MVVELRVSLHVLPPPLLRLYWVSGIWSKTDSNGQGRPGSARIHWECQKERKVGSLVDNVLRIQPDLVHWGAKFILLRLRELRSSSSTRGDKGVRLPLNVTHEVHKVQFGPTGLNLGKWVCSNLSRESHNVATMKVNQRKQEKWQASLRFSVFYFKVATTNWTPKLLYKCPLIV